MNVTKARAWMQRRLKDEVRLREAMARRLTKTIDRTAETDMLGPDVQAKSKNGQPDR